MVRKIIVGNKVGAAEQESVNKWKIDTSRLAAGLYYAHIKTNTQYAVKQVRIIK